MQHGELKVINPPYNLPHPKLELDYDAMASLPESREGTELWTMIKEVQPLPVSTEQVLGKAYFHNTHRSCPIHGTVNVISRIYRAKQVYSIETLACGHTLLVTRLRGSKKPDTIGEDGQRVVRTGRQEKDYLHRGWHFNFKQTHYASC